MKTIELNDLALNDDDNLLKVVGGGDYVKRRHCADKKHHRWHSHNRRNSRD